MKMALEALRAHPAFWGSKGRESIPTGWAVLDSILPDGGLPLGALTEILFPREGIGELAFLMPALARLTEEGGGVAWISPPHVPYGPALVSFGVDLSKVLLVESRTLPESLWATEQILSSGVCGAVLAWVDHGADRALRRLQLASERGKCAGILFRSAEAARHPSPAALRLGLEATSNGLSLQVLKGGWGSAVLPRTGLAFPLRAGTALK
jgi:hypothetical protein